MPENVRYITELIANYSYKGLRQDVLGPTGVNLFMSSSLLYINFGVLVNFYCASWCSGINHGYSASFWTVVHQTHICALTEALVKKNQTQSGRVIQADCFRQRARIRE